MRLYIFEDRVADGWDPFSLSRPCSELRFGTLLLRERAERYAGTAAAGLLTRPWLSSYHEEGAPPAVSLADIPTGEDRLFLSARAVPADGARFRAEGASTLWLGDRVAGCALPAGRTSPEEGWLREPRPLPDTARVDVPGDLLEAVWDLVSRNPARLLADLEAESRQPRPREAPLPDGVRRLGDAPLLQGEGVRLEPGVLLDTRDGPIRLDDGVEVRAGARLSGPLHAGPHSRLLGGSISALAAGPYSYLRGEIEETVVLGWTNKAHDGFLGHAYLGRWVNLGAMTTNSDLKNNYGTVRVGPPGRETDTGLIKVGCFLGDHVKTGIGVLLNTGSVLGAGSNVFGAEMPPKWVPPFSWGQGARLVEYRKDAFLDTAEVVMGRRGVPFDDRTRSWLAAVWDAARLREGPGEEGERG